MTDTLSGPSTATRDTICRDHAACVHNEKFFRAGSECLACERRDATHFLNGETGFRPRCDECLVSAYGCPHAAPNVCPECFDFVTMGIREELEAKSPEVPHA